jgi:hypothetical protein
MMRVAFTGFCVSEPLAQSTAKKEEEAKTLPFHCVLHQRG